MQKHIAVDLFREIRINRIDRGIKQIAGHARRAARYGPDKVHVKRSARNKRLFFDNI
jgi:hypothetical protein